MWKFIITWCVVTIATDPCPDANKVDEFGRGGSAINVCAVHHFHYEYDCEHTKIFNDRDSAMTFYKKAKELEPAKYKFDTTYFQFFSNGNLKDVKIDSVRWGEE